MKKILFLMSMVVSLMMFTSCEKDKTAINMNETLLEVAVGDTCTLVANAFLTNKDGEFEVPIEWSSSDTSVVKIDKTTGFMSASKSDTVTITATANGTSKTREVIAYDFLCNKNEFRSFDTDSISQITLQDKYGKEIRIKFFKSDIREIKDGKYKYNIIERGNTPTPSDVYLYLVYNPDMWVTSGYIEVTKNEDVYIICGKFKAIDSISKFEYEYTFKYSGQLSILNI